jgi:hypothetical protein
MFRLFLILVYLVNLKCDFTCRTWRVDTHPPQYIEEEKTCGSWQDSFIHYTGQRYWLYCLQCGYGKSGYPSPTTVTYNRHYCPGDGSRRNCDFPYAPPGTYYSVRCEGKIINGVQWALDVCTNNQLSYCSGGHYCPGNTYQYPCSVCGTNEFSNSRCNSTHNEVCLPCPPNSVSKPGAFTYLDCFCKPGYYGRVTSPFTSTCEPCPPNKFCPNVVTKKCGCNVTM